MEDVKPLKAANAAGLSHVNLDGIVIHTDRVKTPGPNGAHLWRPGKHKHHGGNVRCTCACARRRISPSPPRWTRRDSSTYKTTTCRSPPTRGIRSKTIRPNPQNE